MQEQRAQRLKLIADDYTGSDGSGPLKEFAKVRRSSPFKAAIYHRAQFIGYTLRNPEPMELTK
jgi:hypothetical protein